MVTVFAAKGLTKIGAGGGDEQESITVHVVSLSGIDTWLSRKIEQGLLVDPKIYSALYLTTI